MKKQNAIFAFCQRMVIFLKQKDKKASDKEFIETALKENPNNREASSHMIGLGFKYLYQDVKTAMYRFNQAYLLDSTNSDIYWGYGGVYMSLGDSERAKKQYEEGLSINPKNTHLLTDYGTFFLSQYYALKHLDEKKAFIQLDSALSYLVQSYQLDNKDPNTTFKLAVCYFQKRDCTNALRYYKECESLGGQPITEDFTIELKELCKR